MKLADLKPDCKITISRYTNLNIVMLQSGFSLIIMVNKGFLKPCLPVLTEGGPGFPVSCIGMVILTIFMQETFAGYDLKGNPPALKSKLLNKLRDFVSSNLKQFKLSTVLIGVNHAWVCWDCDTPLSTNQLEKWSVKSQ